MERDRRFELPPPVWKTGMLTVKHQSRILYKYYNKKFFKSQICGAADGT